MMEEPPELPNALIDKASNFETSDHDKGIQTSTLPNNITEDGNNGVHPSCKGNMVKEAKHSCNPSSKHVYPNKKKRKKCHKHASLTEEEHAEEGDKVQQDEDLHIDDLEAGDVPTPKPQSEPFMPTPMKGDDGPLLRGDSGVDNPIVALDMLNAIVLSKDLAKNFVVSMMTLTTHRKELLYEVSTSYNSYIILLHSLYLLCFS